MVKVKLSVDDCHCIVPVFPANVKSVELVPEQTVAAPEIDPAADVGLTVTETVNVEPVQSLLDGGNVSYRDNKTIPQPTSFRLKEVYPILVFFFLNA